MTERYDLVTVALLGTDRRPMVDVPADTDPATTLLDRAARLGTALRAGAILPHQPPGPAGPGQTRVVAPAAAAAVLDQLLVRPQAELVELWLAAAVASRCGVPPQHWPRLAGLAARDQTLSRHLLAETLGERGRWFIRQNAQWSRLAAACDDPPALTETGTGRASVGPTLAAAEVRADPEFIHTAAPPWSVEVTRAALEVIASAKLGYRTLLYAAAVGVRMPLEHQGEVRAAAQDASDQVRSAPAAMVVRRAFAALEGAVAVRVEIHQAFETALGAGEQIEPVNQRGPGR